MLTVIRHGTTDSNGTHGNERLRGWLPIPLNAQGMLESHEVGEALEDAMEHISDVHSGVHPRHVQTAHEIARQLGKTINPAEEFNDLNTGDFAGEKVTQDMINTIHGYYDEPNKKIPGGETVNNWISRYLFRARPLVEDPNTMHVLVTSGRSANLLLASAENGGGYPDMTILKQRPFIKNAGAFVLDPQWRVMFKTDKASKQAS